MEFDEVISERHSVRNFKETKKPPIGKVIKAIEAAANAPLAGNLSSLKFIIIEDKTKIQELAQASQQDFISKVSYVVAVCNNKQYLKKYYFDRAERYAKHQAGAAIENFLLKITDLGLASCWIGAFSDETVKRILKVPEGIDVDALLPVGYELKGEKPKKRLAKPDMDSLVFFESFKNKYAKPIHKGEPQ